MAVKKVKLADVLWRAANRHLWPGVGLAKDRQEGFSCHAVFEAMADRYGGWGDGHGAMPFLESLGCDINAADAFKQFDSFQRRQGARYMWLLLAMHVAEDEGIEIEVEA